ncbi:sigma-54-dependent Fis family transcriptional regulator [Thalassospira sp. TSL5-1]|uniref:sigma-54-dependent Fis family transcriptional regulator n=1 Tax=Thalassospira sp. TSL5-1 TaxID=1544451 RepID=UPI00093F51EC|nr:sigma-54-dependent Fis family transcriptional regulator [Thalassospira sp. TSL5-1]
MGRLNNNQPHTLEIMRVAEGQKSPQRDEDVQASWRRCLYEHQLDPTRYEGARILTQQELRHHRQASEELLCMARYGMEDLYRRVNAMGYILLLTNAQGVAIDTIGDQDLDRELRHAGLIAGSEWHESHVGTNGVGACLMTGREIIVHRTDHFDMALTPLSCTAVPIHDTKGGLIGVLDLSHLQAPQDKMSQALTLEVMKSCVRRIEMANLVQTHRQDWILRLHPTAEFLDVDPMAAIAIGTDGRIRGMTHNAHKLLARSLPDQSRNIQNGATITGQLIGRTFSDLFAYDPEDLPKLSRSRGNGDGMIELQSGEFTFARAVPPVAAIKRRVINALPLPLQNIHGGDPALQKLAEQAAKLVDRQISIILRGETGTGKEFIAHAMHKASQRRGPFIAINCAALPESLIESELFGYTANAFTGANGKGKKGLIREAHGGTLFLDEIGDMPLAMQARLLRVLSEREVMPVGGSRAEPVDIRVISASHRDLPQLVARGEFRQDLYYRLNGLTLDIPAVRNRADVQWLIEHIARKTEGAPTFSTEAMTLLLAHDWPGNVREIVNLCALCAALCDGAVVTPDDLPPEITDTRQTQPAKPLSLLAANGNHPASHSPPASDQNEAARLRTLIMACDGNISAVARRANVNRSTIYRRLQRLGLGHLIKQNRFSDVNRL